MASCVHATPINAAGQTPSRLHSGQTSSNDNITRRFTQAFRRDRRRKNEKKISIRRTSNVILITWCTYPVDGWNGSIAFDFSAFAFSSSICRWWKKLQVFGEVCELRLEKQGIFIALWFRALWIILIREVVSKLSARLTVFRNYEETDGVLILVTTTITFLKKIPRTSVILYKYRLSCPFTRTNDISLCYTR